MTIYTRLAPIGLLLALAACNAPAAEYTSSEASTAVRLDTAAATLSLGFAPGSSRLPSAEVAQLRQAALNGRITPGDRVILSVGGGTPKLAEERIAAISAELLRYGIIPDVQAAPGTHSNRALLAVDRALVTLPPCPNWSKLPGIDFTNQTASNFGCATASNLGQMVANPLDLASGRPAGMADSTTAVSAVRRYYADKVTLPSAAAVGPIAATTTSPTGSSGGGASGGTTSGSQ